MFVWNLLIVRFILDVLRGQVGLSRGTEQTAVQNRFKFRVHVQTQNVEPFPRPCRPVYLLVNS